MESPGISAPQSQLPFPPDHVLVQLSPPINARSFQSSAGTKYYSERREGGVARGGKYMGEETKHQIQQSSQLASVPCPPLIQRERFPFTVAFTL